MSRSQHFRSLFLLPFLTSFFALVGESVVADTGPELLFNQGDWEVVLYYEGNVPNVCAAQVVQNDLIFKIAAFKTGSVVVMFQSANWQFSEGEIAAVLTTKGKPNKVSGNIDYVLQNAIKSDHVIGTSIDRKDGLGALATFFKFGEELITLKVMPDKKLAQFRARGATEALTQLKRCFRFL
ncbi:MAG: hypothetical protein ACSHXD_03015 [Marinosulfonomonas sp.]